MLKRKIIVVDDDDTVRDCLKQLFEMHGFEVIESWHSQQAIELTHQHQPCLILLDLNLGNGESGFELCKQLRAIQDSHKMKIIILTAFTDSQSQTSGYNYGADGYLTKPFDHNVLVALVNSQLREYPALTKETAPYSSNCSCGDEELSRDVIEKCGFSMNISNQHVWHNGKLMDTLSPIEFKVLFSLLKHAPDTVTRKMFLNEVWTGCTVETKSIDVNIYNLRKKLPSSASKRILSVPRQGYRIID